LVFFPKNALMVHSTLNIQQVSLQHGKDLGEMRWSDVGWSRDFKNCIPVATGKIVEIYAPLNFTAALRTTHDHEVTSFPPSVLSLYDHHKLKRLAELFFFFSDPRVNKQPQLVLASPSVGSTLQYLCWHRQA
jgi:hypothetical protein